MLSLAALAAGFIPPDPAGPLTYCELGCGQGFSANLLAAANPQIRFYANDFNPVHIEGARALAEAAGSMNIRFLDCDFANLGSSGDLPKFDIIALHGVVSWISEADRSHIVQFIRTHLKVGGIVYVSYNALPGWAPLLPLRRLLLEFGGIPGDATAYRIDQANQFIRRLIEVDPGYLAANPTAFEKLRSILAEAPAYVAHEYFNADFHPLYFADLAAELESASLSYVGPANLLEHVPGATLGSGQEALIADLSPGRKRETARDFIAGRLFRRDLYVRAPSAIGEGHEVPIWNRLVFVLSNLRTGIPRRFSGRGRDISLDEQPYRNILDRLADGPACFADLQGDPEITGFGFARVRECLLLLVGAGHVQPAPSFVVGAASRRRTRTFNDAVLDRALHSDDLQHLASPRTGGELGIDRMTRLFLLAIRQGNEDPAGLAHRCLSKASPAVAAISEQDVRTRFDAFVNRFLPHLRALEIA